MKKLMKMVAGVRLAFRSLCAGGCLALGASVAQAEPVEFRDYDAKTGTFTNAVRECTFVTDATRILVDGWYAVRGDVVIPAETNLMVSGDAYLVLCDGASLTVSGEKHLAGVSVSSGNALSIYAQTAGTGRITATGGANSAGIGGGPAQDGGAVTICGGTVVAQGGGGGAGIGGGRNYFYGGGGGGTIAIHGGTVTATGGAGDSAIAGAGIGGGYGGVGGRVTIDGGAVTAGGGEPQVDPIGNGNTGQNCQVLISDGIFWAEPSYKWMAPGFRAVPNTDEKTKGEYPWMIWPLARVTIGEHDLISAWWTSGDGSETNRIGGTSFDVLRGTENVRVIFASDNGQRLFGDTLVSLGTVSQDIVFGVGNDYKVPHFPVVSVVTPIVSTNFNKYGEDVLIETGAVTNDYPSVAAALAAAGDMDSIVLSRDVRESVEIAGARIVSLNLNGFTLSPSGGDDVLRVTGSCSNLVLGVVNGKLSGNLRFGEPGANSTSRGFITLGPELISDGDIFAGGDAQVILQSGFRSTYTNGFFSTEVQLLAQMGTVFGYCHNPENEFESNKLAFQYPDARLIPQEDGTFVVGMPEPDQAWAYHLSSWMRGLPDGTPINKICLPASHDSGMKRGGMSSYGGYGSKYYFDNWNWTALRSILRFLATPESLYATQSLSIPDQLANGTRVFDLRFRLNEDGKYYTWHAPTPNAFFGMTGESFESIFNAVNGFLRGNPSEFVIFEVTHPADANGSNQIQTQAGVIQAILDHPVSELLLKADRTAVKGRPETWPRLNDKTYGDVKGHLIVLVEPRDGTELDVIDPQNGIWGVRFNSFTEMQNGYYSVYDDYANKGYLKDMKPNQLTKWRNHTEALQAAEAKGGKATPFTLDWTLTFNPEELLSEQGLFNRVVGYAAYGAVPAVALVLGLALVAFTLAAMAVLALTGVGVAAVIPMLVLGLKAFGLSVLALAPLWGLWKGQVGWNRDPYSMSQEANPELLRTVRACMDEVSPATGKHPYEKPSMIFYDFVTPEINKGIVELNNHFFKYAAEVVRADGSEAVKCYELNDAFTNSWLTAANNGCTVRLLRPDTPVDRDGYVVKNGYHVKLDLNGHYLMFGPTLATTSPLLTNNGTLEIVNSKPETGGFDGLGSADKYVRGLGLYTAASGRTTVRGVKFTDFRNLPLQCSTIHNDGGTLVLDRVEIVPLDKDLNCDGVTQSDGALYMTNCTIWSVNGSPCRGWGGTIEMSGGSLRLTRGPYFDDTYGKSSTLMLSGTCLFTLNDGEIKGGRHPIPIAENAMFTAFDGFVRGNDAQCFSPASDTSLSIYGGCYGTSIDKKYIVAGECDKVDNYPEYPFEIVRCNWEGQRTVARIVEGATNYYASVQAAMNAAKDMGGRPKIELLANTHPSSTLVFPKGATAVLDFCGNRIAKRGTAEPVIRNLGDLVLTDSGGDGTGGVSMFTPDDSAAVSSAGGLVYNAGKFTLAGATLDNGRAVVGAGIYNESNAVCRVEGGVISNCRATDNGGGIFNCGKLDVHGGIIETCTAGKAGGGIYNESRLTVFDGEIANCTAATGGGLLNVREAVLFGGTVADNRATDGQGAGIYADRRTKTVICGMRVKDNIGIASLGSVTAQVEIYSGLFGERPSAAWIQAGSVCRDNMDPTTYADYPFQVGPVAVAQIGTTRYQTLAAAFAQAVGSRETEVKLLTHVCGQDTALPEGGNAVLDLAGHWILGCGEALKVPADARLRIVDTVGGGVVENLFATNGAEVCSVHNAGACRIEGGRFADPIRTVPTTRKTNLKAGLFGVEPKTEWIDPMSILAANEDESTRLSYPFVVNATKVVCRADESNERISLQGALQRALAVEGACVTIRLEDDATGVSVTVPTGRRAVLDLRGRRLQGVSNKPVITVERGAALVIVDSVGDGTIMKDVVWTSDSGLCGGIVNFGELTLAGGSIADCAGLAFGGVSNAVGAVFTMTGGSIVNCRTFSSSAIAAPAVFNQGTFWMTGGEISDCAAGRNVMAVYNDHDAVFRQMGGEIRDCSHGMGTMMAACYVGNHGRYDLVDGAISENDPKQVGTIYCVENLASHSSGARFAQMWGELSAPKDGCAVYCGDLRWPDASAFGISNGKIKGHVSSSFKAFRFEVSGGFFAEERTNALNGVSIADFCTWETNTDVATRFAYPYRVTPRYEAEVDVDRTTVARLTLQDALNYTTDRTVEVRVRLVTDVKDCVVCTNYNLVTLDLNGHAITGTGKSFADGFAKSVLRNEGNLTIIDTSAGKSGFIAMPSTGSAETGGAICNGGNLYVTGISIFGTRARRGGGIYNAPGAFAEFSNVTMIGCRATVADGGDVIVNEGELVLDGCDLEAWADAENPTAVRQGVSLVNSGTAEIGNSRVRGVIASADAKGGLAITSGLFDHRPDASWIADGSQFWANEDEDTRLDYRWKVDAGLQLMVRAGIGVEQLEFQIDGSEPQKVGLAGLICRNVSRDAKFTVRATYVENGRTYEVEKLLHLYAPTSGSIWSIEVDRGLLFDASIGEGETEVLYPTVTEALCASGGAVVRLLNTVLGGTNVLPVCKRAVLDLNGNRLYGEGGESVIVNYGDLTLRDSSPVGAGRVMMTEDLGVMSPPKFGGGVCNYGRFTLESGVIEGCRAASAGGGIYGAEHSETYIRGGEIRNCQAEDGACVYTAGHVEISGGAVRESIAAWYQQHDWDEPVDAERHGTVVLSGGIFGSRPVDDSWLAFEAAWVPNGDLATAVDYPHRVVCSLECDPIYETVRVDRGYFFTNSTVLAANRIYRFVEDVTPSGSPRDPTLASALSVTGGTTVIYIDEGVTVNLAGRVVDAQPGAGLRVPAGATVVIAGKGRMEAQGTFSMPGLDGGNGQPVYGGNGKGGAGGAGASAAIGGIGGRGGDSGKPGSSGEDMGIVAVLGDVTVYASVARSAAAGGTRGYSYQDEKLGDYIGGGGGGGSGGVPAYAIGGGAGGGAGGGNGTVHEDIELSYGSGGLGGSYLGRQGEGGGSLGNSEVVSCGGDGALYVGRAASIVTLSISNRVATALERHSALRRSIIVTTEAGVELACIEAYLGEPLPALNPNEFATWGKVDGLYRVNEAGAEEDWYDAVGNPVKDRYEAEDLGDVTLFIRTDDGGCVAILSTDAGERRFQTLAAAVAAAGYGSTITIVGDVTGENVKIPSGMTVRIGPSGQFRPPKAEDLLHDYYMVKTNFDDDVVVSYEYMLDADKVTPRVGDDSESGTPWLKFVVDEKTGLVTSAIINILNAYEDLYYGVDSGASPTNLNPVSTWVPASERGSLRLEVPAAENGYFYRVRATDHVGGALSDDSGCRLMTTKRRKKEK